MLIGDLFGGIVGYGIGVFDGAPDNGSADLDSNHAKDFAGRVFVHPFGRTSRLGLLGLGLSASRGDQRGTAAAPGLPTFRTAGQNPFFGYLQDPATPGASVLAYQRRARLNPQLYYYVGPVGLLAEQITSEQTVRKGNDTASLRHSAWHATASIALGGRVTFEGVQPTSPFQPSQGNWGALELAVRLGRLRLDGDTFPLFVPEDTPREVDALAVALNWYLGRSARFSVHFERTTFGAMATRPREQALLTRGQVTF